MVKKITKHDDTWLIKEFKEFETLFSFDKKTIKWEVTTDFQVFSEYLIKDIEEMQRKLKKPNNAYHYYVCYHIFNILDWIKLIVEDAGCVTFTDAWENLFDKKFGDKHILQHMYINSFNKWIAKKTGQYKIGENYYNILKGKLYYHNHFGEWFEVDKTTAFDPLPNKKIITNNIIIKQLNKDYKETWYDKVLKEWENKNYKGKLQKDFFEFNKKETNPEEYFDYTFITVKKILKNPVSIKEIEKWNKNKEVDIEHIVKIANFISGIVEKRRKDNSHTLYLLRDCISFHEMHKFIDTLKNKKTSCDEILIGRKLLSTKPGNWGFYVVTLDALYNAHLRYPTNFNSFYNEYARLIDLFVSLNPKFASVIANMKEYIKKHIKTDKKKIIIFDIGFQGSIALLTKYIIDKHIKPIGPNGPIKTDIEIGVGAEWSKKLFGHRHDGDYFPMLNRVQLLTRHDKLYHYIEMSLKSGRIKVAMNDKKTQHKATLELIIIIMTALIMNNKRKK